MHPKTPRPARQKSLVSVAISRRVRPALGRPQLASIDAAVESEGEPLGGAAAPRLPDER